MGKTANSTKSATVTVLAPNNGFHKEYCLIRQLSFDVCNGALSYSSVHDGKH